MLDARTPQDTEPISVDTRLFVWQRDGGKCRHCGSRDNLHFDHVIPRSWGGASTVENVQVLCRECNLRKGASLVDGRHGNTTPPTTGGGGHDGQA